MARRQNVQGLRLVRWIGLAMALPALVAVLLLGRNAALVIDSINENAVKQEAAALERGLKLLGEIHASELLGHALRDEAFRNVVLAHETNWLHANFGSHALSSEGPQELIVVDPSGRAIFASGVSGVPAAEDATRRLAPATRAMTRARDLYRKAHAAGEGFGDNVLDGVNDGIYVTDMAIVDGHPAMVTVTPFAPESSDHHAPIEPTLLVGIQHLTEATLDKVEALADIGDIEHVTDTHAHETGGYTHAVRDADGNVVTHLAWEFRKPGSAVLWAAAPAILLSLAVVVLLTLATAFTTQRLTRQLAESEEAAIFAARHDTATGLANRGWFMSTLGETLRSTSETPSTRALMLIDCDYFKTVNDTLGHAAGDAVLLAIASRLKAQGDALAIAARLGGDEFALLTAPLARPEDAASFAERVAKILMTPVRFEKHIVPISVSIGVVAVELPTDCEIDAVLVKADLALYRAKRDGRGCVRVYDPGIDTGPPAPAEGSTMEALVRRARTSVAA
ncbi:diguanylate cyclase [Hyphomicrobium sp.]|uniref:diguanylate cyclase domain-containing protein n=1 Tax=Hyphomicrobium sp. TaxID=82 RepID=UPI002C3067B1|nr:diguanylate cyclase [Hyphomicrobium sp.]HRN89794.1 diguanylate cyclase [Hyphomicrobium sp.]HRQ27117.1 diguanylate cyclase [Hyphomicrobium sp.]